MVIIGYSGHAFVVCGILRAAGKEITGYCDKEEKNYNPFGLTYYGPELSEKALMVMRENGAFVAIGVNSLRNSIYHELFLRQVKFQNAIHPSAVIDPKAVIASEAVMVAAGALINPLAQIAEGVICNTGCIIEHECMIDEFAHIGPGAVLCGNVKVGRQAFIGANSVIRQGISIGSNATIGAGSVVVKDVPDNVTVVGVPAR